MNKFTYTLCPAFYDYHNSYLYTYLWNKIDLNNSLKLS